MPSIPTPSPGRNEGPFEHLVQSYGPLPSELSTISCSILHDIIRDIRDSSERHYLQTRLSFSRPTYHYLCPGSLANPGRKVGMSIIIKNKKIHFLHILIAVTVGFEKQESFSRVFFLSDEDN